MAQHIFGVDLGTSNIKFYSKIGDHIINEKNAIAIANKTEIYSIGDKAYEMYEKVPRNIMITFPVRSGVIADIKNMETLFYSFYREAVKSKSGRAGSFCIAVPTDITEVEKKAFFDLVAESRVKHKSIKVVEKPIADAVGVGLNVDSAKGNMIVNIGADTTEISVISLGGIVLSKLIKAGGNKLDETICNTVKKKYNLVIGQKTAEQIKINLANAVGGDDKNYVAYGRNIVTGLPTSMPIASDLVYDAIMESLHSIVDSIKVILERTPPELAADIIDTGIYLTGGSSAIKNFDQLIRNETGLKVNCVDKPSESVINGIAKIISTPELESLMYIPREKNYN